jgi:hypothetical protein
MDVFEFRKIIERIRNMAMAELDSTKAQELKRIADDLYVLMMKLMDDGK